MQAHYSMIHAMVHKLGMDRETYEDMLYHAFGQRSSKHLTPVQLDELIAMLRKRTRGETQPRAAPTAAAPTGKPGYGKRSFEHLEGRAKEYATPAQLRMIAGMWADVSRAPNAKARAEALEAFLQKKTHGGIQDLKKSQVGGVVATLRQMKQQKHASNQSLT